MATAYEKLLGLSQAKLEKQQRVLDKTERLLPSQANTLSPEDLQFKLGYDLAEQVHTRPDGSKFQYQFNEDGTYAHDDQGNWIEEDFNDLNPYGTLDTRNLYIDNTSDGNYKLGLARSDVNPNFNSPFTGEPITPAEARYIDKTNASDVYLGEGGNYDGTPGPKGVTPEDGFLLDVELPYDTATNLEQTEHTNKGQILNRAGGITTDEIEANRDQFGPGISEYTTPDAPLWSGKETDGTLPDDTYMPKKLKERANKPYIKKSQSLLKDLANKYGTQDKIDTETLGQSRLEADSRNAVASVMSVVAGGMDAAHDFIESLYGKENIDTDLERYLFKNDFLNYTKDMKNAKSIMNASQKFIKKADKTIDEQLAKDDYVGSLKTALLNTDVYLSESAGEVGAISLGIPGLLYAVANRTNNDIEAYKANHNDESPDNVRVAEIIAGNVLALGSERLLILKPIRKILNKIVSSKVNNTLKEKIVESLKGIGLSATGEAAQEIFDTAQQKYTTTDEIITPDEAIKSGITAAGIAAGARGAGEAIGIVGSSTNSLNKTKVEKEVEDTVNTEINDLKESATKAKSTADIQDITMKLTELEDKDDSPSTTKEINSIKEQLISKLDEIELQDDEIVKYGSEEEALAEIEELVALGSEASKKTGKTYEINLAKIAKKNNISEDKLAEIKNELQVEKEITESGKGYRTYDRELTRLKAKSNTDDYKERIAATEDKLLNFKQTQIKRRNVLKKAIDEYTALINDDTVNTPSKFKIDRSVYQTLKGSPFDIDLKHVEAYMKDPEYNSGPFKIINNIDRTIDNIDKILDKHSIDDSTIDEAITESVKDTGKAPTKSKSKTSSTKKKKKTPFKIKLTPEEAKARSDKAKEINDRVQEIQTTYQTKLEEQQSNINQLREKIEGVEPDEVLAKDKAIKEELDALEDELKTIIKEASSTTITDQILANNRGKELNAKSKKNQRNVKSNPKKLKSYEGFEDLLISTVDAEEILVSNDTGKNLLSSYEVKDLGDSVLSMANKTKKLLEKTIADWDESLEHLRIDQSPARAIVFNEDGTINDTVAAAIGLAGRELLGVYSDSLKPKDINSLARMLNKQDFELGGKEVKFFRDKGNYRKNVAETLGKSILNSLALRKGKDVDEQVSAKMVTDLGNIALMTLVEANLLELVKVNLKEHNDLIGQETSPTAPKTFNMVRLSKSGEKAIKTAKNTYEAMIDKLGIETDHIKGPLSRKPKKLTEVPIRNNNITESSKEVVNIINKLQSQKYKVNTSNLDFVLNNQDAIKHYMGYNENYDNMTFDAKESQKAKNEAINRSLEFLEDVSNNGMTEMYFNWFYSKNGRYFIDSVSINPQVDKLHRFLFTPQEHTTTIDMSKSKNAMAYKYAIAQSFGFAIDKKSHNDTVAFADKVLNMSPKDYVKIETTLENKGDLDKTISDIFDTDVEIEHIAHLLQGMQSIQDYKTSDGKPFITTISAEYDGVTNGFAIRLMQMPIIKDAYKWLEKVGVFELDKSPLSMSTWLAEKNNYDSYQTLAREMKRFDDNNSDSYSDKFDDVAGIWEELNKVLPKMDGDEVSSALRSLFKDPFMTFNYAASIKSIRESLSYNIMSGIMEKALENKDGKYDALRKALWDNVISKDYKVTFKSGKSFSYKTKSYKGVDGNYVKLDGRYTKEKFDQYVKNADYMNDKAFTERTMNLVNESYGFRVEQIMSDKFAEFMEVNDSINKSFKLMFQAYKEMYDRKVKELVDNEQQITEEVKLNIVHELRDIFPIIKAPYSKDVTEGIPLYATSVKGVDNTRFRKVQTPLKSGKTSSIDIMLRDFEEAQKAGAVVPIHYIDGKIMGDMLLGKDSGVLPIHDAIMPSIFNTYNKILDYNKGFVESNKDYSLISEVLDSVKRADKYIKDNDLSMPYIEIKKEKFTLTDNLKDLEELNNKISKARNELYSKQLSSMQIAGMPDTNYRYNSKTKSDTNDLGSETGQAPTKNDLKDKYTNLGNAANYSGDKIKEVANELESTSGIKTSPKLNKHLDSILDKIADNNFLREANIYMMDKARKSRGWFLGKNIAINVAKRKRITGLEKSSKEVYVHELLHGISHYALKGTNPKSAESIRKIKHLYRLASNKIKWTDLMPEISLDKTKEEQEAKDMWNYIFKNKDGNGMEEFIAHGLSNEQMMNALNDKVKLKEDPTGKTFIEKLKHWFDKLIDVVFGRVDVTSVNGKDALETLVFELAKYNSNATKELEDNKSLDDRLFEILGWGDKKVAESIGKLSEKMVGKDLTPFNNKWSNARKILWLGRNLPKMVTNTEYKGVLERVVYGLGIKPEGTLMNIIHDMTQPDKLARAVERLGLYSDNIDSEARSVETATKDGILSAFKTKLKKREQEALTDVILDLDVESIYGTYKIDGIHKLLKDKKELTKAINSIRREIYMLDKENYHWMVNQSQGLGYYLVTHQAGVAQNLNAYNIASKFLTDSEIKANPKMVKAVDKLSTLYALRDIPLESKNTISNIIDRDSKAVEDLIKVHRNFKKESQQLFTNEVQQIKGYTKEVFDDTIQLEVRPLSERFKMKEDGFDLVEIIVPDKNGIGPNRKMGVYRSTTNIKQAYNKGATRLTNIASRGTSLYDSRYMDNEDTAKRLAKVDKKRLDIARRKIAKAMEKPGYTFDGSQTGNTPIVNDAGIVTGYRWMMSKDKKKKYMNQDTKVGKVMGRMYASIVDKVGTEEHNKKVLDLIEKDMKDNYIEDFQTGKNGKVYIKIEKDSTDKFVQELYKIIPDNMRQAIKDSDKGYIAVRRDLLHHYFGFRNFSLNNTRLMGLAPSFVKKAIRYAEMIWQEIVKIAKVDIIIRVPFVFLGNILSNFVYSVQMGTSPAKVAKMQLSNLRNTRDYLRDYEIYQNLKYQKSKGKRVDTKIKEVQKSLKRNPVSELMDAGLFQAIIEDVSKEDLDSNNRLTKFIDDNTENSPEWVKSGLHWAYISERTSLFQFMTKATQYSDFVARATEYQVLRSKGVSKEEAINEVLDAFVNYNKVSSSFEQYINDMGLVMFTKYAKRIQRAISKGIVKHPVNFLVSILGQEMLGLDLDDITDQQLFTKQWEYIFYNPVDTMMRAVTPTMGELAFEVAD